MQSRNYSLLQYPWLLGLSLPMIQRSDWSSLWLAVVVGCTWLLSPVVPSVAFSFLLSLSPDLIRLYLSLYWDWLPCLLVWASPLHLRLSPPFPQPHICGTVQHPPFLPPSPLPSHPYPFTTHSTSTRFSWARLLEGHHTLSCLSRIFLHQGLRQKPHTHSAVALGGKYLLSFCQCQHYSSTIKVNDLLTVDSVGSFLMQMLLKTVHINVCITSLNAFLWECRQKLCKYVRLPFHTRHYCCHVMAPHPVAHTAGPSFLLPSTPTGSETGRQQQAQLNSDFEFWVDGTPLVR